MPETGLEVRDEAAILPLWPHNDHLHRLPVATAAAVAAVAAVAAAAAAVAAVAAVAGQSKP